MKHDDSGIEALLAAAAGGDGRARQRLLEIHRPRLRRHLLLLRHRLSWTRRRPRLPAQPQHVLDLLRLVLLAPAEHIRLVALRVPYFVHLRLYLSHR